MKATTCGYPFPVTVEHEHLQPGAGKWPRYLCHAIALEGCVMRAVLESEDGLLSVVTAIGGTTIRRVYDEEPE